MIDERLQDVVRIIRDLESLSNSLLNFDDPRNTLYGAEEQTFRYSLVKMSRKYIENPWKGTFGYLIIYLRATMTFG